MKPFVPVSRTKLTPSVSATKTSGMDLREGEGTVVDRPTGLVEEKGLLESAEEKGLLGSAEEEGLLELEEGVKELITVRMRLF